MLDADTKRRIDTARDILVGKVPDPKSQVEQITIALIYKFMDDIDARSEEWGGKRKFFAGDFARYGWARLIHCGLGGHEILNLYSEAIDRMPQNPGIPQLFRDIFENAYLPYRDPQTLRTFLEIIDEFSYDHSERLGDAFEYLLSVLGSQGDAGQFRTPRHIIDFIVAVIDPKKDETLLDPACGTAGFLVSSYKHVLANNADDHGNSTLTPDEKARLAANVKGYDISPDMVRLSLVNMYLHDFVDPHIFEYDTLTSEERWHEYADVILANPPFMSPKGGIRPHNRFSVKSKRSEVLFVDYMAEHLTPSGRAGIIVPEGIIFQSQNAYKQLRKTLVEEYLVAVVSLPAGVFQPYSGVKTSILLLDRSLAKRTNHIGFFKVENDGFDLGAQRRPIESNDLPQAREEITAYLRYLRSGELLDYFHPTLGLIVEKEKIAANGEYNLSGERYRKIGVITHNFPVVRIGDVCSINPSKSAITGLEPDTKVSFVPMADLNEHRMKFEPYKEKILSDVSPSYTYFADNDVLLAKVTPCFENGKAGIARGLINGIGFGSSEFYVFRCGDKALSEWLYHCIMHPVFRNSAIAQMTGTGGLQRVPKGFIENFEIPLPPLHAQKEIVAEIEGYQKVIDGASAVVDHYRPHIPIDPNWPTVTLGDVSKTSSGGTPTRGTANYYEDGKIPWLRSNEVSQGEIFHSELFLTEEGLKNSSAKMFHPDTVLVAMYGATAGEVGILRFDACTNQAICGIVPDNRVSPNFLYLLLKDNKRSLIRLAGGGAQPNISQKIIREFKISLPSLETQQAIVAEIESEEASVEVCRDLVERFEGKIRKAIGRVWGEDEIESGELIKI